MSLYRYTGRDKKGHRIEDIVQASSKQEAMRLLSGGSIKVLSMKEFSEKGGKDLFEKGISVSDKAAFCRFMATMLRSGLPLAEAIDIIRQESENKHLAKILLDTSLHIRKGGTLSSVLSKYKTDFDPVFLTLLKAGEESGTLEKSFDYLASQLLASYELTQKVKSAMMYPAIILIAMVGVAGIMLGFVLPQMSKVFLSLNVELPVATKFILNLGDTVGNNLLATFLLFFGFIIFIIILFVVRKTRTIIFSYIVKLPVINKVMDQLDTARFARTLSTLLKSGVSITIALDVSSDVLSQPHLKAQAKQLSAGVMKGQSLAELLADQKHSFPATVVQTIRAGEKTGSLELVLEELASFFELEVDYSLKRATSLIEPLLMLLIGIAVGTMVVMMISPIYSIVGGLEGSF